MSGATTETIWQLFRNGPTWDGNLASKSGRDELIKAELADRSDGWNWLTSAGVMMAIDLGFGRKKDAEHRQGKGQSK